MINVGSGPCGLSDLQINLIVSAVSSLLVCSGWWILADIDVHRVMLEHSSYYIPGAIGTVAFIFINILPAHCIYESYTYQHPYSRGLARTHLFIWLMISFGCLIGGFYILTQEFLLKPERLQWPGYGICLHNIFVFTGSMLLRFGKKHIPFF